MSSRCSRAGPLRPNAFRQRPLAEAVRAAGLDPKLTPLDLRDTAATLAFAAGASVKEVANMLGHDDATIGLKRCTGVLNSMAARTDDALELAYQRNIAQSAAARSGGAAPYLLHSGPADVIPHPPD